MTARNDGDELAARRSERIIEQARQSMVRISGVEGARRVLAKGAAKLVKQGYARGVPGPSPVPYGDGEIGSWVDLGFCRAVTASGARCKAPATAEDGWCGQHRAVAERQEARRAAVASGLKPPGAKAPAGGTAGRTGPEEAKAKAKPKTGRPGHSEPFRPFPGQCSGWVSSKNRQCRQPSDGEDGLCLHHRPKE